MTQWPETKRSLSQAPLWSPAREKSPLLQVCVGQWNAILKSKISKRTVFFTLGSIFVGKTENFQSYVVAFGFDTFHLTLKIHNIIDSG